MKQEICVDEESPFNFSELFFSKTDLKGIILSGNSIFQRVSEYTWNELLQKPHNIIRHPDMPRAVFYLLWKFLKEGKPIGAFVKNRSKTGKRYWVFALALPVSDGYLSVRLKPSGKLLQTIEGEYKKLREVELSKKITPEESVGILDPRIKELGFRSYSDFMSESLIDQILNRTSELKINPATDLSLMIELKKMSMFVVESTTKILNSFISSKHVPLNLEIFSSSQGKAGNQISVVASEYQKISLEIAKEIKSFSAKAESVALQISESQFLVGAAILLKEVGQYLKKENSSSLDIDLINNLVGIYLSKAHDGAKKIEHVILDFISACVQLNTLGLGLELVRITGKMELARMNNATEASSLLESLQYFQNSLKEGLLEILEKNRDINDSTKELALSLRKQINDQKVG